MSQDIATYKMPEDLSERPNVLEVLEKAPALLAYKARIVVDKRSALKKATMKLKALQAAAKIKYKEERNMELIKAYCDADEDVQKAEVETIEADAALKIAELEHEEIYHHFISARKVGGMDDAELHALRGSTIRGGVVRDSEGRQVDMQTGEIVG